MKWLFCLLLLFGGVGSWAGPPPDHTVRPGENLGTIAKQYGYDWRVLCAFNGLADCNKVQADRKIRFPERRTSSASPKPTKEVSCITLGVAPFNPEHKLAKMLVGIDLLSTLTAEQKQLAKEKVLMQDKATEKELVGQQIFGEMLYASRVTGKVEHVYDKPICTPEQGGQPEVMDTYDLGEGVFLSIPRRCGNPAMFVKPVVRREEVQPQPEPEPEEQKEEPEQVAPEPEPQEIAPEEAVRRWDWELVVGKEYDRTSQATFGSGAVYGFFVDGPSAEHAFGIGGMYNSWHGKTDTEFDFNGRLWGYGLAYKYSDYGGGWDFGFKLLPWASLTENGESGSYQSHRQFDLRGITLAYNNAARELKGEKSFFKYQLFISAFKPMGGAEIAHSWNGKSISDTTELQKLDHVVNVGGRIGLYDFSEEDDRIGAKLWFATGWFQEAPSLAETANWRLQVSDMHERVFVGFGRNYDLLHGGSLFGFGLSWDIRKTVYVHREESRKAQFIMAIEKAGGSLDKDGMVILPKGMKSPRQQFKIAPSDD